MPSRLTCGNVDLSGADRTRTDDFLLAKQVLYQLSYRPGEMQKTRSKTPARVLGTPWPQSKESNGRVPRMTVEEIGAVIDFGLKAVDLDIQENTARSIVTLPQGLPHYAHLLGQEAARAAIYSGDDMIEGGHFQIALEQSIKKANQSIARAYHTATVSPRRTIFEEVLLACALADHDDLGYFAPADVREALSKIMNETYEIPRFANHLSQFCEEQRGPVLERRGGERRWRYRFRNPMLEPYVLIRGLNEGKLDDF
jgi:hypothetical protein